MTVVVGGSMGAVLEIMPDNGEAVVPHAWADPGLRHVALRVDDLEAVQARLEAAGIAVSPSPAELGTTLDALLKELA